jgi:hypothetical protein
MGWSTWLHGVVSRHGNGYQFFFWRWGLIGLHAHIGKGRGQGVPLAPASSVVLVGDETAHIHV